MKKGEIKLTKNGTGQKLWRKAKKLIPGGNQLLSKRIERFLPEYWPAYHGRGKGAEVSDLDGNRYLDMCIMGIGTLTLGYADPDVDRAVIQTIKGGSMGTLNSPQEIELAELLIKLHPWAQMVRYARSGGESMAIAARIARAYSGKEKIAFCGYHGWADWYLAANLSKKDGLDEHLMRGLEPKGVPHGLKGTILPFRYNHFEELEKILKENEGEIAAVIMEPVHGEEPTDDFLKKIRNVTKELSIPLVFDEITMGFRLTMGGAHLLYGIEPDMAIFAKGMSNGYPMAAILGREEIMQAAQDTFISSTYWTEAIGPTAALATIKKMKDKKVHKHLRTIGVLVRDAWQSASKKHGIEIGFSGPLSLQFFAFKGKDAGALKTLFVQEMLRRGFLASDLFYASYAHTPAHVKKYAAAIDEVFGILKEALNTNTVEKRLLGPIARAGFERLN
ncbi:aminotransferase class III-fold pyridoxal phosphate-dependent enzyme [Candidatus Parcubacteria bacterium]|nr:MAG: aminotransferase class III-fold pyridoxal phosphate-dependent enzyme [Candidatus Parcubacteria bacterium]